MKKPFSLLFVTIFAAAVSGYAEPGGEVSAPTSLLHPRATPAATAAASSKKPFEASLSGDEKGKSSAPSVTNFSTSTGKIYLSYTAPGATKGESLKVAWIAEDAKGYVKNKKLTEAAGTLPGPGAFGSYYLPTKDLAVGKYRADVFTDGKLVKSLKFTVK